MKIVRVDMTNLKVVFGDVSQDFRLLGGRALTSAIISKEVPATCHPLRSKNKLVLAPGLVTGTKAPSSGRLSIGTKSPLTCTIKEANAGGISGQKLARLGIKAIIIEGQPIEEMFYTLFVDTSGIEIIPSPQLKGVGVYKLSEIIRHKYGQKVGLISIGPAGEMKMLSAGISTNDIEGEPSRYAARGGVGAVMGSKGIKAIIIDDDGASGVEIQNKDAFNNATKKLTKALLAHPVTNGGLRSVGTLGTIDPINEVGGLPTRNFREGRFSGASRVTGLYMAEIIKERKGKGKMGHPCHPGCIIMCSNIYPNKDGDILCAPLEYESAWALGPNLGIDVLDDIAMLNRICNDAGIDTIEIGCTLGVLMDAGVLNFGDGPGAISLLQEVASGTPIGRIIGMGAENAGKAYGVTRVPTVKGQSMPAYDPRAIKGIGITYATGTMGADHTSGYTISPEVFKIGGNLDPLETHGKWEVSQEAQAYTAFIDSTGLCLFATFATAENKDGANSIIELLNAQYGVNWDETEARKCGAEIIKLERGFNVKAGFTKAHDRLPDFMYEETLPPHNQRFDVSEADMQKVFSQTGDI